MIDTIIPTSPKTARWLLQAGLAFVFAYAAIEGLRAPNNWIGFVPNVVTHVMSAGSALKLLSIFQLFLAAWLLSGRWLQYAALIAALMLAGITVGNPHALDITFRDIGLCLAALALAFSA